MPKMSSRTVGWQVNLCLRMSRPGKEQPPSRGIRRRSNLAADGAREAHTGSGLQQTDKRSSGQINQRATAKPVGWDQFLPLTSKPTKFSRLRQ